MASGDVADASTASGIAGALFSAGADGVSSVTLNSVTSFQAIRVVDGVASPENVVGSPTTSVGGATTWIATGALSRRHGRPADHQRRRPYSFTTFKSLVHSVNGTNEEELAITFAYTVRDGDNDAVNGSLIVSVDDDTRSRLASSRAPASTKTRSTASARSKGFRITSPTNNTVPCMTRTTPAT